MIQGGLSLNQCFSGFSHETMEFFMAIRFNNNRDFFHANHDWYDRAVRQPCLALAEDVQACVRAIDADIEVRPARVVSRINRDIRFSNDKSPYRDYMWLHFRRPTEHKGSTPGFYFDIGVDGVSCGMGFYDQNKPLMNALRYEILRSPEGVRTRVRPLEDRFLFCPKSFKRMKVPDSVPEDLRSWYTLKGFYLERPSNDMNLITSPTLADWIIESYEALAPLYRFLMDLVPLTDMPEAIIPAANESPVSDETH